MILGWIGSVMCALCGFPQACKCFKQGHAKGVSKLFILMWLMGEICFIIATLTSFGFVGWLMLNYFCNIFFISIILRYLIYPRKNIGK
jgi:uncharacterized protein with PQ loop repeat